MSDVGEIAGRRDANLFTSFISLSWPLLAASKCIEFILIFLFPCLYYYPKDTDGIGVCQEKILLKSCQSL